MGAGPQVWGHMMFGWDITKPLFFLWSCAWYQEPRDRKEQTFPSASNSGKKSGRDQSNEGARGHVEILRGVCVLVTVPSV